MPTKTDKVIEELKKDYSIWKTSDIRGSPETRKDDEWMFLSHAVKAIKKLEQEKDKRIESLEIQNTELYEINKEVEKRYKLRNDDAKDYAKNLILLKKEKQSNEMEIKSIRKKLEELDFYKKDRRLARQELNKYLKYFNENIELQKEINELKTKLKEKDKDIDRLQGDCSRYLKQIQDKDDAVEKVFEDKIIEARLCSCDAIQKLKVKDADNIANHKKDCIYVFLKGKYGG